MITDNITVTVTLPDGNHTPGPFNIYWNNNGVSDYKLNTTPVSLEDMLAGQTYELESSAHIIYVVSAGGTNGCGSYTVSYEIPLVLIINGTTQGSIIGVHLTPSNYDFPTYPACGSTNQSEYHVPSDLADTTVGGYATAKNCTAGQSSFKVKILDSNGSTSGYGSYSNIDPNATVICGITSAELKSDQTHVFTVQTEP